MNGNLLSNSNHISDFDHPNDPLSLFNLSNFIFLIKKLFIMNNVKQEISNLSFEQTHKSVSFRGVDFEKVRSISKVNFVVHFIALQKLFVS